MIANIETLKAIKAQDLVSKRLTYIAPIKSHEVYIRDELMWVEEFDNGLAKVFRCMDGKIHSFSEQQLEQFRLIGR